MFSHWTPADSDMWLFVGWYSCNINLQRRGHTATGHSLLQKLQNFRHRAVFRVSAIRFTPSLKHCPFTGVQTSRRWGLRLRNRVHHSAKQRPPVYWFPHTIHTWSFHHLGLGCQTEQSAWDRRSRLCECQPQMSVEHHHVAHTQAKRLGRLLCVFKCKIHHSPKHPNWELLAVQAARPVECCLHMGEAQAQDAELASVQGLDGSRTQ